jgi:hypothetical protein
MALAELHKLRPAKADFRDGGFSRERLFRASWHHD